MLSPMQFGFLGLLPAFFFSSIVPSLKADELSVKTFGPVEGVPPIIAQPPMQSAAAPPTRNVLPGTGLVNMVDTSGGGRCATDCIPVPASRRSQVTCRYARRG